MARRRSFARDFSDLHAEPWPDDVAPAVLEAKRAHIRGPHTVYVARYGEPEPAHLRWPLSLRVLCSLAALLAMALLAIPVIGAALVFVATLLGVAAH